MSLPLSGWLELLCAGIPGAEAGLALLGSSEHAPGALVARWPGDAPTAPRLSATVETARAHGRPAAQSPAGAHEATQVALPVLREGEAIGAVGVSVRGLAPGEIKSVAEQLDRGLRGLALLREARAAEARAAELLSWSAALLDETSLAESAHSLATALAQRLDCERVAVGLHRGRRLRVVALSSSLRFAHESDAVRDLRAAMEEAVDQDAAVELPEAPGAAPLVRRAHEELARGTGAGALRTLPLADAGRAVGALTFEWGDAAQLDALRRERVDEAAALCGPILALMARADAGPLARAQTLVVRWRERHFGEDRALARGALLAAAALLVLLAVVPATYRISARASLEGRIQRALVAAVPGYLSETNARAGDLVRTGDVLARLDDRDLRLEARRWASQKAQLEQEYREALAGQDRTQVSILRAQIEQAAAQLGLAQEQLGRTQVVAPFDGVVLHGDWDRELGSPVDQGDVLFELAPLDGYRIIVEVDDRDIADVAVGQGGRLALSALPDRPLPLVVERITPISTSEDGRNYFRVEAVLEEPVEALRPGMEGVAKIDAGTRRLLWIWTHELLDWLRLSTWWLLP